MHCAPFRDRADAIADRVHLIEPGGMAVGWDSKRIYTDHRYLVDQKQPLSAQFQRHQQGEKKGQPFYIALSGYACGARWCGAPIESCLYLSGPGCGRHLIRRTCHLSNTHAVVRDLFPPHSRTDRRRDCGWDQTPSSFFTDPSFTSTRSRRCGQSQ